MRASFLIMMMVFGLSAYAQEAQKIHNIEYVKSKVISKLDKRIAKYQIKKDCILFASSRQELKQCGKTKQKLALK